MVDESNIYSFSTLYSFLNYFRCSKEWMMEAKGLIRVWGDKARRKVVIAFRLVHVDSRGR